MSEDNELHDDIDWYLTIQRLAREGWPPSQEEDPVVIYYTALRLSKTDPLLEPVMFSLCLELLETKLEGLKDVIPNRLYRVSRESVDGWKDIWETMGMEPVAQWLMDSHQEDVMAQIRREIDAFKKGKRNGDE